MDHLLEAAPGSIEFPSYLLDHFWANILGEGECTSLLRATPGSAELPNPRSDRFLTPAHMQAHKKESQWTAYHPRRPELFF